MFQRAVFKQSVKRNLVQLRARADNLNADVAAKFNLGWIFIRKKTALMFQLLQNNQEISLSKKEAKNVLLGKSHLYFNQELQKHSTLFPLAGLDWLCMDSRFRFFSPHWFRGSLMAKFVTSSDIFLLEFAFFIENPYLLPVYLIRLKARWTIAEI